MHLKRRLTWMWVCVCARALIYFRCICMRNPICFDSVDCIVVVHLIYSSWAMCCERFKYSVNGNILRCTCTIGRIHTCIQLWFFFLCVYNGPKKPYVFFFLCTYTYDTSPTFEYVTENVEEKHNRKFDLLPQQKSFTNTEKKTIFFPTTIIDIIIQYIPFFVFNFSRMYGEFDENLFRIFSSSFRFR